MKTLKDLIFPKLKFMFEKGKKENISFYQWGIQELITQKLRMQQSSESFNSYLYSQLIKKLETIFVILLSYIMVNDNFKLILTTSKEEENFWKQIFESIQIQPYHKIQKDQFDKSEFPFFHYFYEVITEDYHQENKDILKDILNTPLHIACSYNTSEEIILLIISLGAEINAQNLNTPLHIACKYKLQPKIIQLLLQNGASVHIRNENTPLHDACWDNFITDVIKLLIQYGADVNAKNKYTPLHDACKFQANIESIQLLLAFGAEINSTNGITPLHHAAEYQMQPEVVDFLLKSGANLFAKTGKTPFDLAANQTKKFLGCYSEFIKRMNKFLKRQENTDVEIITKNGSIYAHSLIIQSRTKIFDFSIFQNCFKNFSCKEVLSFLSLIYSGYINFEEIEMIYKLGSKIGMKNVEVQELIGKKSVIENFSRLYSNDSGKKFTIISFDEEIKVHPEILMITSHLYRGMFINVKDDSNRVHDYSEMTTQALKTLVSYFYFDDIPDDTPLEILEELDENLDYFGISENSMIAFRIEEGIKKYNL
ncbi:ankyrin repeat ph and sec7 domain containing protein secg-related [Anaeramoeba ignava]|uniref:Ankyrin repeat ph and sec7 domain containing protein secg-related n=1 Tax=Anaeramoeba ignava TaxID=1746090 RepID=A0A9Q0LNG6_ANAIG|nr:ankyrin repeat ph and sec7 domain containing protein secg-related [Anaeramoeba ignava]